MKQRGFILFLIALLVGGMGYRVFSRRALPRPSAYACQVDQDCLCHCCQASFATGEISAEKLNDRCPLFSKKELQECEARGVSCLVACAFSLCGKYQSQFSISCLNHQCVWTEKDSFPVSQPQ